LNWLTQVLRWPILFLKDWPIKLGALAVAIILALYVQFAQSITKVLHIRVTTPEIPPGLVFSSRVPSFMDVQLYGPADLMDVPTSEFKMQLLNQRPLRGENVYRVTLVPDLPHGIEASYSREIKVALDETFLRELPVEAVLDTRKVQAGGLRIRPRTVVVRGPYQKLAEMDRVLTVPVSAEGPGAQTVKVILAELPEFISLADGQPNEVQIDLWDRQPKEDDHIVDGIQVKCANVTPALRLRTPPTIRIRVPIAGARPEQFRASVFCPVFVDPRARSIRPSYFIPGMTVEIEDMLGRTDRPVCPDGPAITSLQFEKVENPVPLPMQQGQQEHIFR